MGKIKIAILTLIVLSVSYGFAAPQTSMITGQITDSEGGAIGNARVLIHWDSAGSTVGLSENIGIQQDMTVITDSDGRYSANVPAGFYDLFVSSMAFTPIASKVRVKQGHRTTFNAKLAVDPLVSKELAH